MTPEIRTIARNCVRTQIHLYIQLRELELAIGKHRDDPANDYDWTNDMIISLSHGEAADVTDEMIDDAIAQSVKRSG